jgi:hypothetical protein
MEMGGLIVGFIRMGGVRLLRRKNKNEQAKAPAPH